jgi:hypothetical protein
MHYFLCPIKGGLLFLIAALPLFAQYADTVKIMTYNIDYDENKNTQYDNIIQVIKAIDPTIAGLQKLDSCMGTGSNPCFVPKLLGDQTNMSYEFITGDPKSYGDGFLTKQPPKSVRKIKLTGSANIPRAALEIGVTVGGEPVRVIVTHLDLSAANRTAEMKQIIAWMDSGGARTIPAVIMADFNAQSTEDCMQQLVTAGFAFIKTSTGVILDTSTGQKINHILYRPENRWKIVDIGNPKYTASNRNPLWALMSLLNPVPVGPRTMGATGHAAAPRAAYADGMVRIRLYAGGRVSLRLFSTTGRLVMRLAQGRTLGAGTHSFAVPEMLTKGTYLLETAINGATAIDRISVIK